MEVFLLCLARHYGGFISVRRPSRRANGDVRNKCPDVAPLDHQPTLVRFPPSPFTADLAGTTGNDQLRTFTPSYGAPAKLCA